MTLLAVGDLYQARLYVTMQEQTGIIVRHYRISDITGGPTDADLADAVDAKVSVTLKDCLVQLASYRGVGVQRINPLPKTVEVFNTMGQGVGTQAGEPLPKQVCAVITLRTQFAGPRYRGRAFVPFPAEADNGADAKPTAAMLARLVLFADKLDDALVVPPLGGGAAIPVVYSRKFGTREDILQASVRSRWGTQRRRGDFGATNISPI